MGTSVVGAPWAPPCCSQASVPELCSYYPYWPNSSCWHGGCPWCPSLLPFSPGPSPPLWPLLLSPFVSYLPFWSFTSVSQDTVSEASLLTSSLITHYITHPPWWISSIPIASFRLYELMASSSMPWFSHEFQIQIYIWIHHRYLKLCVPPNPCPCLPPIHDWPAPCPVLQCQYPASLLG